MAQRITWQNVAAPDFGAAVAANRTAGDMFARAAERIGDSLGSLDYRNRTKASNRAMDKALGIDTLEGWNKAMANGGLESFGVDPGRATPALMEFMQNRRRDLGLNEQRSFDLAQSKEMDERRDLEWQRQEEDRARNEEAAKLAAGIRKGTYSLEEGQRMALSKYGDDPKMMAAIDNALTNGPAAAYKPDANVSLPGEINTAVTGFTQGLNAKREEALLQFDGDPVARIYADGMTRYNDSGDVGNDLISELRNFGTNAGLNDREQEAFDDSIGEIRKKFNELKSANPGLSDKVIASAMRSNLEHNGWTSLWAGDKQQLDISGAEADIAAMSTVAGRNKLREAKDLYDNEIGSLDTAAAQVDDKVQRLRLAITRGSEGEIRRLSSEIQELTGIDPTSGSDPAKALMAGFRLGTPAPSSANQGFRLPDDRPTASRTTPDQGTPAPSDASNPASMLRDAVAQGANRGSGFTLGAINEGLAEMGRWSNGITRLYNPELADRSDDWINGFSRDARNVRDNGISSAIPERPAEPRAPREAPAPRQAPAGPAVTQAADDPDSAIQAIAEQTGLPPQMAEEARVAAKALREGRLPDGSPVTRETQRELMRTISRMLQAARTQYGMGESGGENAAAGLDPRDPVVQLLSQPDNWLRY